VSDDKLPLRLYAPRPGRLPWRNALESLVHCRPDGHQSLGHRRAGAPETGRFLREGIGDRRLQHTVPIPRDHPAAERHTPHGPPRSGDVAPVRTHLPLVELRRGRHQARLRLRRRAAASEGKDDPVPRRDQTEGGAGLARGRRNRGPRDREDESHADVATHGGDDRPIEALVGSPRGPGRAGARGGRSAGERDGSKRDRLRCRVPGLRLPPVRLPAAGEEPRDQRPAETPPQGGLRGGPPGGDLPRCDPREVRSLAVGTKTEVLGRLVRLGRIRRERLYRARSLPAPVPLDFVSSVLISVFLTGVLSALAYRRNVLTWDGSLAAFVVGMVIGIFGDVTWLFLLLFFLLSSFLATRYRFALKEAMGVQEGIRGERRSTNVLA